MKLLGIRVYESHISYVIINLALLESIMILNKKLNDGTNLFHVKMSSGAEYITDQKCGKQIFENYTYERG